MRVALGVITGDELADYALSSGFIIIVIFHATFVAHFVGTLESTTNIYVSKLLAKEKKLACRERELLMPVLMPTRLGSQIRIVGETTGRPVYLTKYLIIKTNLCYRLVLCVVGVVCCL